MKESVMNGDTSESAAFTIYMRILFTVLQLIQGWGEKADMLGQAVFDVRIHFRDVMSHVTMLKLNDRFNFDVPIAHSDTIGNML